jgi:hypothetical protein
MFIMMVIDKLIVGLDILHAYKAVVDLSNECYNWVKKRNSYSVPGYSHYHPPPYTWQR